MVDMIDRYGARREPFCVHDRALILIAAITFDGGNSFDANNASASARARCVYATASACLHMRAAVILLALAAHIDPDRAISAELATRTQHTRVRMRMLDRQHAQRTHVTRERIASMESGSNVAGDSWLYCYCRRRTAYDQS